MSKRLSVLSAPDVICLGCHEPIKDGTATSIKHHRCRPCYNLNFQDWVHKKKLRGELTGTRAHLNAPALAERALWNALRWPQPQEVRA